MVGQTDGREDRRKDGWKAGRTDGRTDGRTNPAIEMRSWWTHLKQERDQRSPPPLLQKGPQDHKSIYPLCPSVFVGVSVSILVTQCDYQSLSLSVGLYLSVYLLSLSCQLAIWLSKSGALASATLDTWDSETSCSLFLVICMWASKPLFGLSVF